MDYWSWRWLDPSLDLCLCLPCVWSLVCDCCIHAYMHIMTFITKINFKELRSCLQIFSDHGLWTKEHLEIQFQKIMFERFKDASILCSWSHGFQRTSWEASVCVVYQSCWRTLELVGSILWSFLPVFHLSRLSAYAYYRIKESEPKLLIRLDSWIKILPPNFNLSKGRGNDSKITQYVYAKLKD